MALRDGAPTGTDDSPLVPQKSEDQWLGSSLGSWCPQVVVDGGAMTVVVCLLALWGEAF